MLCFTFCAFLKEESKKCLGVEIVESQKLRENKYQYHDFRDEIFYYDEKAAIDFETSTIYVPQKIKEGTNKQELEGLIKISNSNYRLFFEEDPYFNNLYQAVKENHTFKLFVLGKDREYMQYKVVFTTLPVMRIDGSYSHEDIENRPIMAGEMCLWPSNFKSQNHQILETSNLEWRIRGATSACQYKKPWKLNLKKDNGDNRNIDLLGLGSDDDWILNPMNMDDLKIREKLFITLWNQMQGETEYNYPMSNGEYVELVLNGRYHGLFLLQRRIDKKYLNLEEDDILFKGKQPWTTNEESLIVKDVYDLVYSSLDEENSYELITNLFELTNVSNVDLENSIDLYLFLQYASALDNMEYKNMFYIFNKTNAGDYKIKLDPWDTDMSFGLIFDDGFKYNLDVSLKSNVVRKEMNYILKNNPDIYKQICDRWIELRSDTLNEDHVLSVLNDLNCEVSDSGALRRDSNNWHFFYKGKDTYENMIKFICERTKTMDEWYGKNENID